MRVQTRACRHSDAVRYLATAAVVILMVFGLLFIGNEDLRASDFKINILEWFEDFFVVENDTNLDKDDESDVLFHESQIGYIPEGFEKVAEEVALSRVIYEYQNDKGEFISVLIYRDRVLSGIDNVEIEHDIKMNEAGLEYRCVYKEESKEHMLSWVDRENRYYILSGSIEQDELIKIMDDISY